MKVIKSGKMQSLLNTEHTCTKCKCIFKIDAIADIKQSIVNRAGYLVECPECKAMVEVFTPA